MKFSFSLFADFKSIPCKDARFRRFVAPVSTPIEKSASLDFNRLLTGITSCQKVFFRTLSVLNPERVIDAPKIFWAISVISETFLILFFIFSCRSSNCFEIILH